MEHEEPSSTQSSSTFMLRLLQELDLHYLVIAFVFSLILMGGLGTVREPMIELKIGAGFRPSLQSYLTSLLRRISGSALERKLGSWSK